MIRLVLVLASLCATMLFASCTRENPPSGPLEIPSSDLTGAITPTSTSRPSGTGTPATPAATGTAQTGTPRAGAALTVQDIQRAWEGKQMRVTVGSFSTGYDAFGVRPTDVSATKGNDSLKVNVLIY